MVNNFGLSPLAYEFMSKQLQQAGRQPVTGPLQALATALSGIPQGLASRERRNREEITQGSLAEVLGNTAEAKQIGNINRADPALAKTLLALKAKRNAPAVTGPVGKVYTDLKSLGASDEEAKQGALDYHANLSRKPTHEADVVAARETAKDKVKSKFDYEQQLAGRKSVYEMTARLRELAPVASHNLGERGLDWFQRQVGMGTGEDAAARAEYQNIAMSSLLPKLKQTFGGQLSEEERKALLSTLGDINYSPEEKLAAIDAFEDAFERDLEDKRIFLGEKVSLNSPDQVKTPKFKVLSVRQK